MKGYRLDTRINKSAYLDFKKQMLPQKFEIPHESQKPLGIQFLQANLDDENQKNNLFVSLLSSSSQNVTQSPQLKKYLIQSCITEFPLLSSLNKIELYLNRQKNELKGQSKAEEMKSQKNHSQSTEVYSVNKVA
ncbi:unnamed protein product (macronuclear) [Paramecium tetraurelia]|uniref:Uncharacterized protein n=1 Tax=Paramecium tetraurelia TaxID=5888 RepID=A0BU62_PARTE|nr:uncharacterized protein GSPATT00032311001 [Paramecium tetraurelia]CAK62079.1 unnamed protein product [Paramecium tetraurelia]|eukprot:XP_001429477.1 hypothetical protein (macronuclear) [Paramecium tetraurelia strain d4-2]